MELPDRIKIVRESLELSQKDMAKAVSVSLTALQGYEAGRSVPGGDVIKAFVKLGFNANWLLTGEGEMRRGAGDRTAEPGTVQHILDAEHKAEINQSIKRFGCYPLDQGLLKRSLEGAYEWVKTEGLEPDPETIFKIMMYRYNLVATMKFGAMDKEGEG